MPETTSTARRAPRRNAKDRPNNWMSKSACSKLKPQEMDMFSSAVEYGDADLALIEEVCYNCPVLRECGNYGRNERYGVWGGTIPFHRGFASNGRLAPDAASA